MTTELTQPGWEEEIDRLFSEEQNHRHRRAEEIRRGDLMWKIVAALEDRGVGRADAITAVNAIAQGRIPRVRIDF
jgi:hypothetical protein